MKPFDLEKALAGEPLITRGGDTDVRFVRHDTIYPSEFPLEFGFGGGIGCWYRIDGTICIGSGNDPDDLFMAEPHELSRDASDASATAEPSTVIAEGTPSESGVISIEDMLAEPDLIAIEWWEPRQAENEAKDVVFADVKLQATVRGAINLQRSVWTEQGQDHVGHDRDLLLDFLCIHGGISVRLTEQQVEVFSL